MQYVLNSELRLLTHVYGIVVKLMHSLHNVHTERAILNAITSSYQWCTNWSSDHTNYFEPMFSLIMVTSHKGALN